MRVRSFCQACSPDRMSVCPTNTQLLALYSSSSLSFLELLQAPTFTEPVTGSLVDACNLAQHTVTDVCWVPVALKKKEKMMCCCVATSSGVVLLYQFTDEGSVLSPSILFTFLAQSPVKSVVFADPFLITFHDNGSVLFLKCNADFAHPLDERTYLQGSEIDVGSRDVRRNVIPRTWMWAGSANVEQHGAYVCPVYVSRAGTSAGQTRSSRIGLCCVTGPSSWLVRDCNSPS